MNISKRITKFQEGGPVPAPAPAPGAEQGGAPAPGGAPAEGGGDPIEQIAQIAMQALETEDCEAAMAVCEAFVSLLQGGGGEGAPAGPEAGGAPVYRRGGRLVKRVK